MLALIETEFLKMRRSRTFYLILVGSVAPSILMFLALVYVNLTNSNPLLMSEFYDAIIQTSMWFFNIILYGLVGGYLIANEYRNHTLKSIVTAPVSREKVVLGKWLTFEILVVSLAILSFMFSTVLGYVGGAADATSSLMIAAFKSYIAGSFLLSLPMSIFLLLGFIFKNSMAPIIIAVIVGFSNTLLMGKKFAALTPYLSPYLYLTNQLGKGIYAGYGLLIPWSILMIVSAAGVLLSILYFRKADITL